MKHKRAGRKGWKRALSDTEQVIHVPGGVIVDYVAGEVIRPLDVGFRGRSLRILDSGFRWVHYAPAGEHHALTAQLDAAGQPVQLYVDICDGHGLDPDGIPFVNDLYLDVLAVCEVQPDGHWHITDTEIIDVDELDEALQTGKITRAQYDMAWREAKSCEARLRIQSFPPVQVLERYTRGLPE